VLTQPFALGPNDRASRREQALRDGYLYIPRLLSREMLAPLRALIDAALRARGWIASSDVLSSDASTSAEPLAGVTQPALKLGRADDARWFAFLAEVLPSDACRSLAEEPALLEVVRDILGAEIELHVGTVCRIVSPGDPALSTPPHQDAAYVKEPEYVWTAWIPLVSCPREMGPLAVWAGSNRGGLRPHGPVEPGGTDLGKAMVPADVVWTTGDLELGDVVLFSSLTVHRAMDNVTADRLRVSVDYRYRARTSAG
jgi:ectoine hydroxylase-related dioxygenase (phytanoyl-CoA dioxygenase family)